jgi:hypothetical protein
MGSVTDMDPGGLLPFCGDVLVMLARGTAPQPSSIDRPSEWSFVT